MDRTASDAYLETRINTASPQQLRLMLVEEAIRRAHRTIDLWNAGADDAALEDLIRCRAIVSELLAGVKDDGSTLSRQVLGVYLFLFNALTEAQVDRDGKRLTVAIRVLEEERATWQAVCQQLPAPPATPSPAFSSAREELAPAFLPAAAREAFSLDA
jgi:flagellar protein FliS